jgi:hypothetical protein
MRHPVTDDALGYVKGYYDSDCLPSCSVITSVPALVKQDPMMGYENVQSPESRESLGV